MAIVCLIVAAGCNLYLPWIIKDMIDDVLVNKDMETMQWICLGVIIVFLIRGVFYFGQTYLVSYVGQRVIMDVRLQLFRKFQRASTSYYDKHQTGSIMSYITNDVGAMQAAVIDNLVDLVTESSILIGSIAMMIYLNWQLTLICMVLVPVVSVAMKIFGKKQKSTGLKIQ